MGVDAKAAVVALPLGLATDVLSAFTEVVNNFEQHRWEPSELNGGKLCEAVFTAVEGYLSGSYADRSSKPRNMVQACQSLEQKYPQAVRSARIQIPRMLVALYAIRNNRGVGHAGGDVDPNQMDATVVLYMSKWLVAELVRLLHTCSTQEAADVVEELVERQIALIWQRGDKKRVLQPGLSRKEQLLLLLAGVTDATESEVIRWMEDSNKHNLRNQTLRPLHKARWIEFDEGDSTVRLLPPGIEEAEKLIKSLQRK
ncbi:hypothetical protein [Paenarthrobacter ilicis]|uniref:hypothetical protein n=1 Tax=Paenarthrobacter ilicis TaxID=43665 RepID=UPI0028D880C7|nr:hypothetical protein [Paenarthrobacter ilicis]